MTKFGNIAKGAKELKKFKNEALAKEKKLEDVKKKLEEHAAKAKELENKVTEADSLIKSRKLPNAIKGIANAKAALNTHMITKNALNKEASAAQKELENHSRVIQAKKKEINQIEKNSSPLKLSVPKAQQKNIAIAENKVAKATNAHNKALITLANKNNAHTTIQANPTAKEENKNTAKKNLNVAQQNVQNKYQQKTEAEKELQKAQIGVHNNLQKQFTNLPPNVFLKNLINTNKGFRNIGSKSSTSAFIANYTSIIKRMLTEHDPSPRTVFIVSNIIKNIFDDPNSISVNIPILNSIIEIISSKNGNVLLIPLIELIIDQICLKGLKKNKDYLGILEKIKESFSEFEEYIALCLANNVTGCGATQKNGPNLPYYPSLSSIMPYRSSSGSMQKSNSATTSKSIKGITGTSIFGATGANTESVNLFIILEKATSAASIFSASYAFTINNQKFKFDNSVDTESVNILAVQLAKSYFNGSYSNGKVPSDIFGVINLTNTSKMSSGSSSRANIDVFVWNGGNTKPMQQSLPANSKDNSSLVIIKKTDIIQKETDFIKLLTYYKTNNTEKDKFVAEIVSRFPVTNSIVKNIKNGLYLVAAEACKNAYLISVATNAFHVKFEEEVAPPKGTKSPGQLVANSGVLLGLVLKEFRENPKKNILSTIITKIPDQTMVKKTMTKISTAEKKIAENIVTNAYNEAKTASEAAIKAAQSTADELFNICMESTKTDFAQILQDMLAKLPTTSPAQDTIVLPVVPAVAAVAAALPANPQIPVRVAPLDNPTYAQICEAATLAALHNFYNNKKIQEAAKAASDAIGANVEIIMPPSYLMYTGPDVLANSSATLKIKTAEELNFIVPNSKMEIESGIQIVTLKSGDIVQYELLKDLPLLK